MPTELEELVEFLHHGNTQIRQIAAENLVGYSTAQPSLFKRNQLEPIKDLKLLVKDYSPIAKNALNILVNVSEDSEVLESLATDDVFLESLLRRVTDAKEPNANLHCMLLANLAKSPSITRLLTLQRAIPKPLSTSPLAIDQLLDCFVKGAGGTYNPAADYDYLCYLFADLAKHEDGRRHFLTPRREGGGADDSAEHVVPLSKLIVFTEHASTIRRRGVANTIKNVCFEVGAHEALLADDGDALEPSAEADTEAASDPARPPPLPTGTTGIGLLPYVLLPLMGDETYSDEDADGLPEACQLLPPDKAREPQPDIVATHLESLLLLSTERAGRDRLRAAKVYPVVRELHVQVEDDGVREGCDRLVQVLMRGEEGEEEEEVPRVQEVVEEEDEDEQVVEVL